MSTDLEIVDLTEIVGDLEIPCDYADSRPGWFGCPNQPGRWLLFTRDHGCGTRVRVACEPCKTARLTAEDGAVECALCGHITAPPRHAYSRIEAL